MKRERSIITVRSNEFPCSDFSVLLYQVRRDRLGVQEAEAHPAQAESPFELTQFFPLQVAAQFAVKIFQVPHFLVFENRPYASRAQHIHEDDVLPRDQFARCDETLREERIVQRSQKNEQGTFVQPHADERAEFLEVGRYPLRLERVKLLPAGIVVPLSR